MDNQWKPLLPGYTGGPVSTDQLRAWVQSGRVKPFTQVTEVSTGIAFSAAEIPGVYSDKSWVVASLLSFFLGVFGVDRFYLGYSGQGLGKLLTAGGFGIWALIDFILIVAKKVPDSHGRMLN